MPRLNLGTRKVGTWLKYLRTTLVPLNIRQATGMSITIMMTVSTGRKSSHNIRNEAKEVNSVAMNVNAWVNLSFA
jgi:hypothetical protein